MNTVTSSPTRTDRMTTITRMSIMTTINWLHRNCHTIRYILKGDPDSYFNMPKIVDWLERLPPERQKPRIEFCELSGIRKN